MPRKSNLANSVVPTTAQSLGSLIKSARDIMRKDKGLNGDLDRLPLLTWIMFLKFLDDLEIQRESEAGLRGTRFRRALEPPYRWRDWAARVDGITGDGLLTFVNQDECIRPDGSRGPGLFAYLRNMTSLNGDDRREVIATVFRGVVNRMKSGYLLREVINKVSGIHFTSSEELHVLSALYESMLREMRDAAGDSGEIYTPRPIVNFMVEVTRPQLGETVLDPACGTGGFLVEAFNYLSYQVKKVADRKILQEHSIFGGEAKSLPFLLCQMNLLLHGLDTPHIDPGNSLRFKLTEIGEKDRVDIILTNPPFGGEEEPGIKFNFPNDMQTNETALLFLQLIMRKLKRPDPAHNPEGGRAAVVMPDGILSQEGVAARIREELLNNFNLHTVVRLPRTVFAPYTRSSTSILFFNRLQKTTCVCFYEIKMRPGLKAYSENQPFIFEEFKQCLDWWNDRIENDNSWKVSFDEIRESGFSLDFRNPASSGKNLFLEPTQIAGQCQNGFNHIIETEKEIFSQWEFLKKAITDKSWPTFSFSRLIKQVKREERVKPDQRYKILAMSWYAKGLYIKHEKEGSQIKGSKLYRVSKGDFIYNRLFAWKGSFAEAYEDHDGCYVSNEYPCFEINSDLIAPGFLWAYFAQPEIWAAIENMSSGTSSTSRLRFKEAKLKNMSIPTPPRDVQIVIAKVWADSLRIEQELERLSESLADLAPAILERCLRLKRR